MILVPVKKRRFAQPQGPVQINSGNSITQGLSFAVMPGVAGINLVTGEALAGARASQLIGAKGVGAIAPDPVSYPTVKASLGSAYTIFAFGEITTAGVQGSPIDDDDGATRAFLFRINTLSGVEFIPFDSGNTPVVISSANFTANELAAGVAVAGTINATGSAAVWANGKKTTGSLGAAPRIPSTTIALLNRKAGGTQIPTTRPVYLCCGWNRVLSDGELASLSANPWQIFAPIATKFIQASTPVSPIPKFVKKAQTKQPTNPVTPINWNNAMTKGMALATYGSNDGFYNSVDGMRGRMHYGGNKMGVIFVGAAGLGYLQDVGDNILFTSTYQYDGSQNTAYTIQFVRIKSSASSINIGEAISILPSGVLQYSTGYYDAGTTLTITGTNVLPIGAVHTVSVVRIVGVTLALYLNGKLEANIADPGGRIFYGWAGPASIGAYTGGGVSGGAQIFFGTHHIGTIFTADMVRAYHDNVYQIFQPAKTVLFAEPSPLTPLPPMLPVTKPRYRQPQVRPVLIDGANPSTRGLRVAEVGSIPGVNLADGMQSTVFGAPIKRLTSVGFGPPGASDTYFQTPTPTWSTSSSSSFTLLAIVERVDVQAGTWDKGIFFKHDLAGNISLMGLDAAYASGLVSVLSGVQRVFSSYASELVAEPVGSVAVYVARFSGGTMELWKNGVFQSSNSTGSVSAFTGYVTTAVDPQDTGTRFWTGAVPLRLGWDRAITDTEICAISANPWKLFAPQKKFMYTGSTSVGGIVSTVGSSIGSTSVTAISAAIAAVFGSSSGISTVSAFGGGISQASGSATSVASSAGASAAIWKTVGSTIGTATLTSVARAISQVTGAASGTSVISGAARTVFNVAGNSVGTSTVAGTTNSIAASSAVGQAIGTSTANATANSLTQASGTSTGVSTATGTTVSITQASGSAIGSTSVAGTGRALSPAAGSGVGTSTASASVVSIATSNGSSTGTATLIGNGITIWQVSGNAAGIATVYGTSNAVAGSTTPANGTAVGTSTANATGASLATSSGAASGSSTANGQGITLAQAIAQALGSSTASGGGVMIAASVGSGNGTSGTAGSTNVVKGSDGSAVGSSTAQSIVVIIHETVGMSLGVSAINAVSAAIKSAIGSADGHATVSGITQGGVHYTASGDKFNVTIVFSPYAVDVNSQPYTATLKD